MRDDIVAGVLPFGARVTIAHLAKRYEISQMPAREALRALHGEGLLSIEPNRGALIRTVDREFIGNVFDIRSALEVLLTRKMVMRATPADIRTLREIEARFEACIDGEDYAAALRANREFHSKINTVPNNPDAVALLDRHSLLIAALWHRYGYGPDRFSGVINDHRHLIEAIDAHDIEAAGTLMNAHVIKAKHSLLARVELSGEVAPGRRPATRRTKLCGADSDALIPT